MEFIDWLISKRPTNTNTPCVVDVGIEKEISRHPSEIALEKLRSRPKIYNKIFSNILFGKRSDADFVIAKACVELGISFEEYFSVLIITNWSKVHDTKHAMKYAKLTYDSAERYEQEYQYNIAGKWR